METTFSALGHTVDIRPQSGVQLPGTDVATQGKRIGRREIAKAAEQLREYKHGKQALEQAIIDNERWYKLRHWDALKRERDSKTNVQPASAWLFNSLANKHADAMDNYPEPYVLPREAGDQRDAKSLSAILPCIVEHNDFERTYNDAWWYKLKNGTSCYGVFWDPQLENGLGDISIRKLDLLNIYWQPGVTDIQDSRNLFITSLIDDDLLHSQYPDTAKSSEIKTIDVKQYVHDDYVDVSDKSVVVDWYYRQRIDTGETVLHYVKFCGDVVLYASEDDPQYADTGFYAHGRYPIELDVLFPQEGMPTGFGYINVMRDPQMYIDKLNQIIIQNAYLCGKPRFFARNSEGVNLEQFLDWEQPIVNVEGQVSEDNLRQIQVQPLPSFISSFLEFKINELKETSGNRDFSQGSTSSGVTAAAAISALQEAGNKLSRDMLKASYRTYTQIIALVIELIRQFYDEARCFRIEGQQGGYEFVDYDNSGIKDQLMPPAYPGAEQGSDYAPSYRRPIFDIKIKPQKSNPFSRLSQNELAKELYQLGAFNPQMADQALGMLDMMDFEGKQQVVERVQQGQTLLNVVQQMQLELDKMAMVIEQLTGRSMQGDDARQKNNGEDVSSAQSKSKPAVGGGNTSAQAQNTAADNAQGGYAARMAARATPHVQ